jgi:PKD repeat protein
MQWGSAGSGAGQFNQPRGLAINSSGYAYVADGGNFRVEIFDPNGAYISQWGSEGSGNGQFNYPVSIAINSTGYVFVTDGYNNRTEIFDTGGNYVSQWGTGGDGNGQFNFPEKISVDSSDNIYIADWGNSRVQVFDPSGAYVTQFGSEGKGDGQFSHPIGLQIDSGGNLYVADTYNNRIQKFSSTVLSGSINVSSVPKGAEIFLDGKDISHVTPYLVSGTSAGQHWVNLTMQKYLNASQQVQVSAGQTSNVNLTLTPPAIPGVAKPPTDPNHDGLYEDLNGNGRIDFNDVVLFFHNMAWITANEPVTAFDFNHNGRIDFNDIVVLSKEVGSA